MSAPELSPSERRQVAYFDAGKPADESWHLQIQRAIAKAAVGPIVDVPTAALAVKKLIDGDQP